MTHNTINTLTGAITEVTHTLTKTEIQDLTDKIPAQFNSRQAVVDCYFDSLKSFLAQLVGYLGTDGYVRLEHKGTHKNDELEFGPLVQADVETVNLLVDKLNDFYYHKVMDIKYTDDSKEMLLNTEMAHKRMNTYSLQIVVPANHKLVVLFDSETVFSKVQNTPRWDCSDRKYFVDLADTFTFQQGFVHLGSIDCKETHEAYIDSPNSNAAAWVAKHNQAWTLIDTFNVQVATLKQRMLKSAMKQLKPTKLTAADNAQMNELLKTQPIEDYVFINPEHLFPLNVVDKESLFKNQLYEEDDLGDDWGYGDSFQVKQTFQIGTHDLFVGNIFDMNFEDAEKPYADAVLIPVTEQLRIPGWLGDSVKSENYDLEI